MLQYENFQNHERSLSPSSKSKQQQFHGFSNNNGNESSTNSTTTTGTAQNEFKAHLQLKVDELLLKFLNSKETQNSFLSINNNIIQQQQQQSQPSIEISQSQQSIPTIKSEQEKNDSTIQQIPEIISLSNCSQNIPKMADEKAKFAQRFKINSQITKSSFIGAWDEITKLPSFVGSLVFNKIYQQSILNNNSSSSSSSSLSTSMKSKFINSFSIPENAFISLTQLLSYWETNMCWDEEKVVFDVLKQRDELNYIGFSAMKELVLEIVHSHPGLEILKDNLEFRERYAETVTIRIFFGIVRSKRAKMSFLQFKQSNFLDLLYQIEVNPDINENTEFFSYSHFYVIYCKFWELDTDHNLLISSDELARYSSFSLSRKIIDRIMSQPHFETSKRKPGQMHYFDFVWFILAEEDKSAEASLEFWFRCIDIDGDGVISAYELEYFYSEQIQRLARLDQELVSFKDFYCQIVDMIRPDNGDKFTMKDIKRNPKLSSNMFNQLFNIHKFVAIETEDPYSSVGQDNKNQWDKFASIEYSKHVEQDRNN